MKQKIKCDTSKCKASCCYNVPHTKYTLNTNKKNIVNPIIRLLEQEAKDNDGRKLYLPVTDNSFKNNKCPFLRGDCRCNIYDNRPWVCRMFGTPPKDETSKLLRCGWLEGKLNENVVENQNDADTYVSELMMRLLNGDIKI